MNDSRSSRRLRGDEIPFEKSPDAFRVCTWNINEGVDIRPCDYGISLEFMVEDLIERASIDLLALQELPMEGARESRVLLHIANNSPLRNTYATDLSPSFSGLSSRAGLGLATKFPIVNSRYFPLPNPKLSLLGGQGLSFDKGVLAVGLSIFDAFWNVIVVHNFPFHRFGVAPNDDTVLPAWQSMSEAVDSVSDGSRTLVLGDFNASDRELIIARTNASLYSAMNGGITHDNMAADDILLSSDVSLSNQPFTIANFSDHLACLVDVQIMRP